MNEISVISSVREVPGRFSVREFIHMKDVGAFNGMKVELVEGEIIRMNPPNLSHGTKQAQIIAQLFEAYKGVPVTIAGETGILLDDETVRAFDAVVVRDAPVDMKLLDPALVVLGIEISDTTLNHDLGPKADNYARANIPEYWVVDVNGRCIYIMRKPQHGVYNERMTIPFSEDITPPEAIGPVAVY